MNETNERPAVPASYEEHLARLRAALQRAELLRDFADYQYRDNGSCPRLLADAQADVDRLRAQIKNAEAER